MSELATASTASPLPEGAWTIDPGASIVGFRVRHFGFATVHGRFRRFAGQISGGAAAGSVDVGSIVTGNRLRDARLLSPEFFDAERFPSMTFATSGPGLAGWLTIGDVSRRIALDVEELNVDAHALELRATATISRRAFGLDWAALKEAGRLVVSDRVTIVLDLRARPAAVGEGQPEPDDRQ